MPEPVKPDLVLSSLKEAIIEGTQPEPVFLARANRAIRFLPHYGSYATSSGAGPMLAARGPVAPLNRPAPRLDAVKPVMAYPVFKDPMGPVLQRRHPDLFLPNVGDFPANVATLLEYNHAFIEAYMVGLNHAFGSELLWREYPTDLRGSYFRQFWDASEYMAVSASSTATPEALANLEESFRDIKPIASWNTHALGNNRPLTAAAQSPSQALLLAVRADLLKRYPNTVVCAAPGVPVNNKIVPDLANVIYPNHRTTLGQDIILFSFALTADEVRGDFVAGDYGYFFVFHERPGEPQFGLDILDPSAPIDFETWDDLNWDRVDVAPGATIPIAKLAVLQPTSDPNFSVVTSSARFAYAVFQQPYLVAIHGRDMMQSA